MPETASAENRRSRYRIAGMDCAGCGTKIENTVRRLPGVLNVGVSVSGGTMTVQHTDRLLASEIPAASTRSAIPSPRSARPTRTQDLTCI